MAENDVVVAEGDLIGAVLPDENPIRVLYTNSPLLIGNTKCSTTKFLAAMR